MNNERVGITIRAAAAQCRCGDNYAISVPTLSVFSAAVLGGVLIIRSAT